MMSTYKTPNMKWRLTSLNIAMLMMSTSLHPKHHIPPSQVSNTTSVSVFPANSLPHSANLGQTNAHRHETRLPYRCTPLSRQLLPAAPNCGCQIHQNTKLWLPLLHTIPCRNPKLAPLSWVKRRNVDGLLLCTDSIKSPPLRLAC